MASSPPAMQDQGRLLEEALGVVRMQSSHMRKCLETPGKLMDALKCGCEPIFLWLVFNALTYVKLYSCFRASYAYSRS